MSDISVEKRLQLVRQVRSRYRRDQNDLLKREQILYGTTSIDRLRKETQNPFKPKDDEEEFSYDIYDEFPENRPVSQGGSSFGLRFIAAAMIFVLILMLDKNNRSLFGMTTQQIFDTIAADYITQAEEVFSHNP